MKKILISLVLAALYGFAFPVDYNIRGNIEGLKGMVYLYSGSEAIDSARTEDGTFLLTGHVTEPVVATLMDAERTVRGLVFLEKGNILVVGDGEGGIRATGTTANDRNLALDKSINELMDRARAEDAIEEEKGQLVANYNDLMHETYAANRDNILGLFLLADQLVQNMEPDAVYDEISKFDARWQAHPYMDRAREIADANRKTAIGARYMDISLPAPDGSYVKLSEYVGEGKYVLVDFWASWCGPCIGELPYLKKAYEEYHGQGFEIFGVSLDSKEAAWTKCIEQYGMDWIHVSALQGWKCPAAAEYGVRSIPSSFLVAPDGTIVARSLRGNELSETLATLMR